VSAHPDVILKMGTKAVLYRTRTMSWGCDTALYRTVEAMRIELPARLAAGAAEQCKSPPTAASFSRGASAATLARIRLGFAISGLPTLRTINTADANAYRAVSCNDVKSVAAIDDIRDRSRDVFGVHRQ
jgi:hypothetical protein